jgi:hypothetical protein
MRPWMVRCVVAAAALGGAVAGSSLATAQDATEPVCTMPMPACYERAERAGFPRGQAWWAKPSFGRWDYGYYVGGGTPCRCHGDLRCCHEGTFGWDYSVPWSRTRLRWSHGRLRQAGEGNYEGDRLNDPFQDTFNP